MEAQKLDRIVELLFKQKTGELSPVEQGELNRWKQMSSENQRLFEELEDETLFARELGLQQRFDARKALGQFKFDVNPQRSIVFKTAWKYVAAAVVLLAVTVGVRYMGQDGWKDAAQEQAMIVPGGNKAALLLENGERIVLDENEEGIVFGDSVYYDDGQAVAMVNPLQWLTVVTPKGGTYKLTLADGTKVWLNSGTEFKYQRGQVGEERKVFLDGEAYFEVSSKRRLSKDSRGEGYIPFCVVSAGQEVRVLGTIFNVMAYRADDRQEITLLEGRVSVSEQDENRKEPKLLRPGQQAIRTERGLQVKSVDIEPYVAWKDGRFVFESQKLVNIMATLARWYDIEVVFENHKENVLFTGSMERNASFADILEKIGGTKQVNFRIEGRRVVVM